MLATTYLKQSRLGIFFVGIFLFNYIFHFLNCFDYLRSGLGGCFACLLDFSRGFPNAYSLQIFNMKLFLVFTYLLNLCYSYNVPSFVPDKFSLCHLFWFLIDLRKGVSVFLIYTKNNFAYVGFLSYFIVCYYHFLLS